ncbi:Estradiol 17-beta-dehydrogenase 8 [Merluccius polli]|uniref:Estradiol 17-beta-dehydrogenase 8 n=1 Tax=Merluccius polli TaxID=89951 RepID=A0AA47MMR2_MERPO|nr:Estradiol 17-beta-dehydrogenase 8 [Merluccius polli]
MEEEHFDKVVQVNLKGTFLVTQAVAAAMVASGVSKGSIVTVGSIVGKVGNIGQVNYSASKAGVQGLTRTAAKELSRYGIRCNCVMPGFISTPMTDKVPEKVISKMTSLVPLGRMGEPAEVADVCSFLASDDSRYITGASIEVTGFRVREGVLRSSLFTTPSPTSSPPPAGGARSANPKGHVTVCDGVWACSRGTTVRRRERYQSTENVSKE